MVEVVIQVASRVQNNEIFSLQEKASVQQDDYIADLEAKLAVARHQTISNRSGQERAGSAGRNAATSTMNTPREATEHIPKSISRMLDDSNPTSERE